MLYVINCTVLKSILDLYIIMSADKTTEPLDQKNKKVKQLDQFLDKLYPNYYRKAGSIDCHPYFLCAHTNVEPTQWIHDALTNKDVVSEFLLVSKKTLDQGTVLDNESKTRLGHLMSLRHCYQLGFNITVDCSELKTDTVIDISDFKKATRSDYHAVMLWFVTSILADIVNKQLNRTDCTSRQIRQLVEQQQLFSTYPFLQDVCNHVIKKQTLEECETAQLIQLLHSFGQYLGSKSQPTILTKVAFKPQSNVTILDYCIVHVTNTHCAPAFYLHVLVCHLSSAARCTATYVTTLPIISTDNMDQTLSLVYDRSTGQHHCNYIN